MEATLTRAAPEGDERRRSPRWASVDAHGIVGAQVRPGRDVRVIDVSAGGTLVETVHRLLPGVVVDIHLELRDRRLIVRGRVLRCTVADLRPPGVWYRGAIQFDQCLANVLKDDVPNKHGYELPSPRTGLPLSIATNPTHST